MHIERRRESRVPLEVSVSYFDGENGTHESLTENLSTSGMCLKANGHLPVGSSFHFQLGSPYQTHGETIGLVRWQSPESGPPRVGIQFEEPIEFALPLSAVEEALHQSAEQIDGLFDRFYQNFGEACVWVDDEGRITECDEGFFNLTGYSQEEAKGRPLNHFVGGGDRESLSQLLAQEENGFLRSSKGMFRIQPKQGPSLLSRVWIAPKPPWKASTAICLEHMAEFGTLFQEMTKLRDLYTKNVTKLVALRDEKHQSEKILDAIKRSFPGWMLLLNKDFSIQDIACLGTHDSEEGLLSSFKGMDLRKATGLLEAKVNGSRLCDELQCCAESARAFGSERCRYAGRSDEEPDLFPAGTFSITVNPVKDVRGGIAALLMAVLPVPDASSDNQIDSEGLGYVQRLLGTAATGLTVQSILGRMHSPFTYLLARLNLLRHKLALGKVEVAVTADLEWGDYASELAKIEWQMERLSKQFEYLTEQTFAQDLPESESSDVNESLAKAIRMVESENEPVSFSPQFELPTAGISGQDATMIFVVLLLLAKDSVTRVSDKTINCEVQEGQDAVTVDIQHRAHISEQRHMGILLDTEPAGTLLLRHRPMNVLDTLLCYASLLLKKNNVKAKINNVPGEFRLSLHIPVAAPAG